MKLKTLLLGSAAAMIAVSGARAADAVIAEPEPVEYVRVCDMYGQGFFYIPGTETCINFNGYVRADYTYNDNDGSEDSDTWEYRVRLNVDTRNETDFGTLRSQIRFQADAGGATAPDSDAGVGIDRALISLGGWRLGYSDSFTTTFHGYGLPVEKYDGPYGYDQAIFTDYTYSVDGFSATLGIQDSESDTSDSDTPHVEPELYVGLGYSNSTFGVAVSYLYETESGDASVKASANVTPIDGFTINGWYLTDFNGRTRELGGVAAETNAFNVPTGATLSGVDYTWGVGVSYAATDTLTLGAGYSDTSVDDSDAITVGASWQAAPGLSIRPNVVFSDAANSYSLRVYRTF